MHFTSIATRMIATCMIATCMTVAACVPASEPLPPAGAAGFVTEPSAGAKGEVFVTDDGWRLRFESLTLQGYITVSATDTRADDYENGSAGYLWNGRARVELYTSGLPTGPSHTRLGLRGRALPFGADDAITSFDVDPAIAERFRHPADDFVRGGTFVEGPALAFVVRGDRGDRSIRVALALGASRSRFGVEASLEVRADSLAHAPLPVVPERLFASLAEPARTEFEPFARADDGDGTITAAELRAVAADCPVCGSERPRTLLEILRARTAIVVGTGDTPR